MVEAASKKPLLLQAICDHKYLLCFCKVPGMRAETPLRPDTFASQGATGPSLTSLRIELWEMYLLEGTNMII